MIGLSDNRIMFRNFLKAIEPNRDGTVIGEDPTMAVDTMISKGWLYEEGDSVFLTTSGKDLLLRISTYLLDLFAPILGKTTDDIEPQDLLVAYQEAQVYLSGREDEFDNNEPTILGSLILMFPKQAGFTPPAPKNATIN